MFKEIKPSEEEGVNTHVINNWSYFFILILQQLELQGTFCHVGYHLDVGVAKCAIFASYLFNLVWFFLSD